MPTLQIIKTVDIIDNGCNALTLGFIATIFNSLCIKAAEEPLHNGIIQTVTLATPARQIKFLLVGLELSAGILLHTLIDMEHDGTCWPPFIDH